MRLAIADPPYLGRANRWYGGGGGIGGDRDGRPDHHPAAAEWDAPGRHLQLMAALDRDFDGWVIAAASQTVGVYLCVPNPPRVMVWVKGNGTPSGSRIGNQWEPVLARIPEGRRGHGSGHGVADVLTCGVEGRGFVGAKPPRWTRWVLDILGYDQSADTVVDLFPGSGAVTAEIDQLVIL